MSDIIEVLGAMLDDAVLTHTGRSIGAVASETVAAEIASELGLREEWSDDVGGPEWQRYCRWVTKTTAYPGPKRIAAGLVDCVCRDDGNHPHCLVHPT